jgi:hypothetical protein
MSFWGDFWQGVARDLSAGVVGGPGIGEGAARGGAAAGAYTGAEGKPALPTPRLPHPAAPAPAPGQQAVDALLHPAPIAPGEAITQTAQSALGLGPLAGNLRNFWVWLIIVLVGLLGVWGLLAPGGGVAVIERLKK